MLGSARLAIVVNSSWRACGVWLVNRLLNAKAGSVCVTSRSALTSLPHRCAAVLRFVPHARDASRGSWSCKRLYNFRRIACSFVHRYAGANGFVYQPNTTLKPTRQQRAFRRPVVMQTASLWLPRWMARGLALRWAHTIEHRGKVFVVCERRRPMNRLLSAKARSVCVTSPRHCSRCLSGVHRACASFTAGVTQAGIRGHAPGGGSLVEVPPRQFPGMLAPMASFNSPTRRSSGTRHKARFRGVW